jgi:hypothetical protein
MFFLNDDNIQASLEFKCHKVRQFAEKIIPNTGGLSLREYQHQQNNYTTESKMNTQIRKRMK